MMQLDVMCVCLGEKLFCVVSFSASSKELTPSQQYTSATVQSNNRRVSRSISASVG